jgi:hypothetical protein
VGGTDSQKYIKARKFKYKLMSNGQKLPLLMKEWEKEKYQLFLMKTQACNFGKYHTTK